MPKTAQTTSDNANHSITAKIKHLEELSEWFYGEDFNLDQAIAKYNAATKLATEITHDLDSMKNQVEVLADFSQNNPTT